MVENDVRTSVVADWSAMEISRFHKISSVIGSNSRRDSLDMASDSSLVGYLL